MSTDLDQGVREDDGRRVRDAELYDRLAERASRRFELERTIQWRNAAALWAMFSMALPSW